MAIRVQRHANVSKQANYWMDLTLASSNGAYVGVAEIDLFMKCKGSFKKIPSGNVWYHFMVIFL